MDQIRPWLYIGKLYETQQIDQLQKFNINAMLQLEEKVEQPCIMSLYLPVNDLAPLDFNLLQQGISFIKERKQRGDRTLVACAFGVNRSSAFCMAALIEEEKIELLDAFKQVHGKHPAALPIEPVWDSLCQYYNAQVHYIEALRAL